MVPLDTGRTEVRERQLASNNLPLTGAISHTMLDTATHSYARCPAAWVRPGSAGKRQGSVNPPNYSYGFGQLDLQRHSLLKRSTPNVGRLQASGVFHLRARRTTRPRVVYMGVMYIGQYNGFTLDAGKRTADSGALPPATDVGWRRGIGIYGDMVYMVAQGLCARGARPRTQYDGGSATVPAGQALPGSNPCAVRGSLI